MSDNRAVQISYQNADVAIASIKARFDRGQEHPSQVAAFCENLCGHTWRNYRELILAPDRTPLPQGYRNFKVLDARDGALLGTTWWVDSSNSASCANVDVRGFVGTVVRRRPTAQDVVAKVLSCFVLEEIDEWRSTRATPCTEPGMLELLVDIETRARELIITGDPLPTHIVAFLASRAPLRARRGTTSR